MYTITNIIFFCFYSVQNMYKTTYFSNFMWIVKNNEANKNICFLPDGYPHRSHDHIKARASSLVLLRKRIKHILIKPHTWPLNANTLHNLVKNIIMNDNEISEDIYQYLPSILDYEFWRMSFPESLTWAFTSAHVIQQVCAVI